jgi:hypothetical protein
MGRVFALTVGFTGLKTRDSRVWASYTYSSFYPVFLVFYGGFGVVFTSSQVGDCDITTGCTPSCLLSNDVTLLEVFSVRFT